MIEEERQIRDYASRPRRYVNVDGINELTCGLALLGLAIFGWLTSGYLKRPISRYAIPYLIVVCWEALVYFGGKAIKKYVTYRRTGYVEYRRKQGPLMAFAVGGATAFLVAFALRRYRLQLNQVTLFGPMMLLMYLLAGRPFRSWKWLIAAAMAAGVVFLPELSTPVAIVCFTLPIAVSGAISFWLYLRHTQPVSQESE